MDTAQLLANGAITNPDLLGEVLRNAIFVEDFGCYSCFEVQEEFIPVSKDTDLGKKILTTLIYHCSPECAHDKSPIDSFLSESQVSMYSNGDVHVAWFWDGDGTLFFAVDSMQRAVINHDCKKDRNWEWVVWKK